MCQNFPKPGNMFMGDNSRTNTLMEIPEILFVHGDRQIRKKYVNQIERKCYTEHGFFFFADGVS